MEIACKHCGNAQEYSLRNGKVPNRPKTQCKKCKKWIYINKEILVKYMTKKRPNDQEKMIVENFLQEKTIVERESPPSKLEIDIDQKKTKKIKIKDQRPKKDQKNKIKTVIVKDSRIELNEANIIKFVKEQKKTKLYEMKIRFLDNSAYEITKIVNSLKKKGVIAANRNGWIYLKKRERSE